MLVLLYHPILGRFRSTFAIFSVEIQGLLEMPVIHYFIFIQNILFKTVFMKNYACFFTTFFLHTLEETLKMLHFLKMKKNLTKILEIDQFLNRFGTHSRARRPLHDRHFHTPIFWNPVFERFYELEYQKVEVRKFRIKGYPLWSLFL